MSGLPHSLHSPWKGRGSGRGSSTPPVRRRDFFVAQEAHRATQREQRDSQTGDLPVTLSREREAIAARQGSYEERIIRRSHGSFKIYVDLRLAVTPRHIARTAQVADAMRFLDRALYDSFSLGDEDGWTEAEFIETLQIAPTLAIFYALCPWSLQKSLAELAFPIADPPWRLMSPTVTAHNFTVFGEELYCITRRRLLERLLRRKTLRGYLSAAPSFLAPA